MPTPELVNAHLAAKPDQPGAPCPPVPDVPGHEEAMAADHRVNVPPGVPDDDVPYPAP